MFSYPCFAQIDRVGIGGKREDNKVPSRIRRRGPGLRGRDCLQLNAGNRRATRVLDRTRDVTGGLSQCPCSLAEERADKRRG